jgi:Raf kinase inhibitor-like YbhB/YbcL family protein
MKLGHRRGPKIAFVGSLVFAVVAIVACSSSETETDGGVDSGKATSDASSISDSSTSLDSSTGDSASPDATPNEAGADAGTSDGGADATSDAADAADSAVAPMMLTSGTITNNGRFPAVHTCNGVNTSPALTWTAGPPGTASYAVVMKDLTVPNVHWILYDLPSTTLQVGASVPNGYTPASVAPAGSKQSTVTFAPATYGYLGPCPPKKATPDHDYIFTVYALSGATVSSVAQADTPESIELKIKAQKVDSTAEASLRAKYMQP